MRTHIQEPAREFRACQALMNALLWQHCTRRGWGAGLGRVWTAGNGSCPLAAFRQTHRHFNVTASHIAVTAVIEVRVLQKHGHLDIKETGKSFSEVIDPHRTPRTRCHHAHVADGKTGAQRAGVAYSVSLS